MKIKRLIALLTLPVTLFLLIAMPGCGAKEEEKTDAQKAQQSERRKSKEGD